MLRLFHMSAFYLPTLKYLWLKYGAKNLKLSLVYGGIELLYHVYGSLPSMLLLISQCFALTFTVQLNFKDRAAQKSHVQVVCQSLPIFSYSYLS